MIFFSGKKEMPVKRTDRLELSYDLIFTTPFHAGTGLRAGLIDRTVTRDHAGYLYLPGSTIKGVLRQHCEELSRLYEVLDEKMQMLIASPHDAQNALWTRGYFPTLITRIFGSHDLPGRLLFDDARQDGAKEQYDSWIHHKKEQGRYKALQTEFATQVRLDRFTRTSVPGALYTSEFGSRDILLHGEITGWLECFSIEEIEEPAPTYSLLLLLAGLYLLQSIGGNKSTGKGRCRCEIKALRYGDTAYTEAQWQGWLDHLDTLSYYSYAVAQEEEA
jgi:CRISPR/Cas system CMR subunit Cmr4 (Cas7 group RAMP superfamily)